MKLEIFYHFYIPPDIRGLRWQWMLDDQLKCIIQSKLHKISDVNICISMPMWWKDEECYDGFFPECGWQDNYFCEKVVSYINSRYPFVRVLEVRDISQKNLYEGLTLDHLHEYCKHNDGSVLYIHSKGMSRVTTHLSNWREILDHYMITEWPTCVRHLSNNDIVCVRDLQTKMAGDIAVSGNYWWATTNYIRTLPKPTLIESYPSIAVIYNSERHAYENWITANRPKTKFIVDTGVDHYSEKCYLEDLLNKK